MTFSLFFFTLPVPKLQAMLRWSRKLVYMYFNQFPRDDFGGFAIAFLIFEIQFLEVRGLVQIFISIDFLKKSLLNYLRKYIFTT